MKKDGTLKQLEIDLARNGIFPNSPYWLKLLGEMLPRIDAAKLKSNIKAAGTAAGTGFKAALQNPLTWWMPNK